METDTTTTYMDKGRQGDVMLVLNPTGGRVRSDVMGAGHFGAPRHERAHKGVDFEYCGIPGECSVVMPMTGIITRMSYPYLDRWWEGIAIQNDLFLMELWYFQPQRSLLGTLVHQGEVIGTGQDISKKYGKSMTPHVHLQMCYRPFSTIHKDGSWNHRLVYVNPLAFIGIKDATSIREIEKGPKRRW